MNTVNQATKNKLIVLYLNNNVEDVVYTVTDKGVKIGYVLLTSVQDAKSFIKMHKQAL